MTAEQFVRVLSKCDISGYQWISTLTKFDLCNLNGESLGSADWFSEQDLGFWYLTSVTTFGGKCHITFNVWETTKPGSTEKRLNGSDLWFTTSPIPVEYFELLGFLSQEKEVSQEAGYVVANHALLTKFTAPTLKWSKIGKKKRQQREIPFSELCLL
jgi:hypothetical protein